MPVRLVDIFLKVFISSEWPHQDSNLNLEFRKLLFYPLNYGAI